MFLVRKQSILPYYTRPTGVSTRAMPALRYQMWQAYHDADPALKNYIKSSPPTVATRVMTGLQLLDSTEANASLLKVAVVTLCKNDTEAGFVGAPSVGVSRAERAPQLSKGS